MNKEFLRFSTIEGLKIWRENLKIEGKLNLGEKIEALRDSKLRENRRTERKFAILGEIQLCERKIEVLRENSGIIQAYRRERKPKNWKKIEACERIQVLRGI